MRTIQYNIDNLLDQSTSSKLHRVFPSAPHKPRPCLSGAQSTVCIPQGHSRMPLGMHTVLCHCCGLPTVVDVGFVFRVCVCVCVCGGGLGNSQGQRRDRGHVCPGIRCSEPHPTFLGGGGGGGVIVAIHLELIVKKKMMMMNEEHAKPKLVDLVHLNDEYSGGTFFLN